MGVDMITANDLIDLLGGTAETARIMGVTPQTVSGWRKTGFPDSYKTIVKLQQEAAKRGYVFDP